MKSENPFLIWDFAVKKQDKCGLAEVELVFTYANV